MAIRKFTADLNGGDETSTNEALIFKIYGSADSYVTPIITTGNHSNDANVTVTGDVVEIDNVDVGAEETFKITSLDEIGNEAPVSDVFSTIQYKMTFISANTEWGSVSPSIGLGSVDDFYIEWVVDAASDTLNEVFGDVTSKLNQVSVGRINMVQTNGVGGQSPTDSVSRQPYVAKKFRFTRESGTYKIYEDDVLAYTWGALTAGGFSINKIGRFSTGYADISLHYIDIDGEMFNFNEGSGSTTTGSNGTVMTLNSTVDVEAMWEVIT